MKFSNDTIRVAVAVWCGREPLPKRWKKLDPISEWDVSAVTDMSYLFHSAVTFNDSLENWDVSSVTNMNGMFEGAKAFNQPLEKWDVSRVKSMIWMFDGAEAFNQPLEKWDVSNVKSMTSMFARAISFNQPLGTWNVSRVIEMSWMFDGAKAFNQPLGSWDVSNVCLMYNMFARAEAFNQPLESWDVSKVTSMTSMFAGAISFNQPLNRWNTSSVTSTTWMFAGAKAFNQPLESWDVSNVCFMYNMFDGAEAYNQPLESWDVSNVTDMSSMFARAISFNQPLNRWSTSSVTSMSWMFAGAEVFNQPLNRWNTSSVTSMSWMFANARSFNQPLGSWDVRSVTTTNAMFRGALSFSQPLDRWQFPNLSRCGNMFTQSGMAISFRKRHSLPLLLTFHALQWWRAQLATIHPSVPTGWFLESLSPDVQQCVWWEWVVGIPSHSFPFMQSHIPLVVEILVTTLASLPPTTSLWPIWFVLSRLKNIPVEPKVVIVASPSKTGNVSLQTRVVIQFVGGQQPILDVMDKTTTPRHYIANIKQLRQVYPSLTVDALSHIIVQLQHSQALVDLYQQDPDTMLVDKDLYARMDEAVGPKLAAMKETAHTPEWRMLMTLAVEYGSEPTSMKQELLHTFRLFHPTCTFPRLERLEKHWVHNPHTLFCLS